MKIVVLELFPISATHRTFAIHCAEVGLRVTARTKADQVLLPAVLLVVVDVMRGEAFVSSITPWVLANKPVTLESPFARLPEVHGYGKRDKPPDQLGFPSPFMRDDRISLEHDFEQHFIRFAWLLKTENGDPQTQHVFVSRFGSRLTVFPLWEIPTH